MSAMNLVLRLPSDLVDVMRDDIGLQSL
jgi:hypothetical protein